MKTRSLPVAPTFGLVLSAALLLCGCAALPSGAGPASPVEAPPAWANAVAPAADVPRPAPVPARWWESFGSPELAGLIARAYADNPDLAASRQRIAQARAQLRAAGAALYPALDASASGARNWRGEGGAGNGFQAGMDASYEVDLWGLNRAGMRSAEAREQASVFDRDAMAVSLAADVATAYFQYLNLDDRLGSARRILDIAERVQALVDRQVELGAASGLEAAQQRGTVASLRAGIPQLEQDRAQTLNALAQLLGTTPGALSIRADSLDGLSLPAIAPGLPSELLLRRPDLRRAESLLASARADVSAARAAMLPSIRLTGGAGFSSAELSSLFTPSGFLANLVAGVVAPVFDGGRLAAQRDQAQANVEEAVEAYRSAVVAAFRDVEDALAAIRYLAEIEEARQAALEAARRAYELAEIRYRAGAADFLTLLSTQRSLFQEEDGFEQVRLARLAAAVSLYRALGGGWCAQGCASGA